MVADVCKGSAPSSGTLQEVEAIGDDTNEWEDGGTVSPKIGAREARGERSVAANGLKLSGSLEA
jgi:hypothetical protein